MLKLNGLITAMATPMNRDGSIDTGAIAALADKLIAGGARGLFACGSMGECPSLTAREKCLVTEATVLAAKGRVPVLAGTGEIATTAVIEANKMVQDSGADAVSVVTPFYWRLSQAELLAHYTAIIRASKLPVLLYNIPGNTGLNLSKETVSLLRREEGLYGIKDSSGDFDNLKGFLDLADDGFTVLVGSDPLILRGLMAGAKGCISAPSNVYTSCCSAIYERFIAGDLDGARAAQDKWDGICRAIGALGTFPATVKYACDRLTSPVGPARPPVGYIDPAGFDAVLRAGEA